MTRPGFMLLELLVSMVIASMIALALFASFSQTNRAVYTVDNIVDVSYKQTVAINQLTKDISGAFIPVQGRKKKSQEEDKKQAQENEKLKKEARASSSAKATADKKKPLTKIFYGTAKDGQLNVLTCITNNSTLEYPIGMVRVVYRLVAEKSFNPKKPAYVLLRQESAIKLNFDDFNPEQKEGGVRAYELIGNVKKITVAYTAAVNKPRNEPAAKATSNEQQFEREYKVLNEWVMEEEQEKQYKDYTKIPFAVDVDLVLWDDRKEREHKVSFKIMLPNEVVEYEEVPKPVHAQQLSSAKATAGGAGASQTPAGRQPGNVSGGKVAHTGKASALDQTFSALKTMLLAESAMPQKGTP